MTERAQVVKPLLAVLTVLFAHGICLGAEDVPTDEWREKRVRLLETGTAEEMDAAFRPGEYADGGPKPPTPDRTKRYPAEAAVVKQRLGDESAEVRAVALRILSALDYGAAREDALRRLDNAKGTEKVACIHVLLRIHTETAMLGGWPFASDLDVEITDSVLRRVQDAIVGGDPPLHDLSTWALARLLKELKPTGELLERVRQAIRDRAISVPEKGERAFIERRSALGMLRPEDPEDCKVIITLVAPGNPVPIRTGALSKLGCFRKEKWAKHLASSYMADEEPLVRSQALRMLNVYHPVDQFAWYRKYLDEKGKEGAAIVVEHLQGNYVYRDMVNRSDPLIRQLTPEQVKWLEEAGLKADDAKKWIEALSEAPPAPEDGE